MPPNEVVSKRSLVQKSGFRRKDPRDRADGNLAALVSVSCAGCAILGLISPNPSLTFFGFLVPPLLFRLLWRSGEPPVLLFAATFQWFQAFALALFSNFAGQGLSSSVIQGPELYEAAWLSLIGVLTLACGMKLSARTNYSTPRERFAEQARMLNVNRLVMLYPLGVLLSTLAVFLGGRIPSLRQPLVAFADVKWIPVFLIVWYSGQTGKSRLAAAMVVLVEVLVGFTGYFSTFKSVLFLLLVVMSGAGTSRRRVSLSGIVGVGVLIFCLSSYWQVIKTDYRAYLNQGSNQQVVNVGMFDRIRFLASSIALVTPQSLYEGLLGGIERLGYIDYFAQSIRYVPRKVPHQHGGLWGGAILHVVTPRFLFPNKAALNESARTNQFTGLGVAGEAEGTAISIGYMGESYIDFGVFGMFVPIFLLGYYYGLVYYKFSRLAGYELLGVATATALLLSCAHLLETSNIKIVGGLTAGVIMIGGLLVFFKESIWRFLTVR
jgi:hypothetical protein